MTSTNLRCSSSSGAKSSFLPHLEPVEAGQVAADADVEERRVRPQLGPDALLAGLASGVLLDQAGADLRQCGLDRLANAGELVLGVEAAAEQVTLDLGDRVAIAPALLLLLGPVAEGAARERAVLVEVAVGLDLDDGRAAAVAHVLQRLLHGEVHGDGVHPVDLPAGDAEAQPARGESRDRRSPPATVVDTAYWLFSMKKHTGSFHAAARFMVSSTEPMLIAPSPK